ncbi:MAG: hypothetical protein ACRC2V_09920 [Xenococcaceae cyanobacterium]
MDELKIGSTVKFCHETYEAEGIIVGEFEDGRSAGTWIVSCPDRGIKNAVFYKDKGFGEYYCVGNWAYWIAPKD